MDWQPMDTPIGLTPEHVWEKQRKQERLTAIWKAIRRYTAANMPIPVTWLDEFERLWDSLPLQNGPDV